MKSVNKFCYSAVAIVIVAILAPVANAQSMWQFGKQYTPKFEETWRHEHAIPATHCGIGRMTAVDPETGLTPQQSLQQLLNSIFED